MMTWHSPHPMNGLGYYQCNFPGLISGSRSTKKVYLSLASISSCTEIGRTRV